MNYFFCFQITFDVYPHVFRRLPYSGHFGHGHFGQNRFRKRGHCSLYINNIYIIVADFDNAFSILTILTLTVLTAQKRNIFWRSIREPQ